MKLNLSIKAWTIPIIFFTGIFHAIPQAIAQQINASFPIPTTTFCGDCEVYFYQISSNGRAVFFLTQGRSDGVVELWSSPIRPNGIPIKLNGNLLLNRYTSIPFNFDDGRKVGFTVGSNLYSAPISGGTPTQINPDFSNSTAQYQNVIERNGKIIFAVDGEVDERYDLYVSSNGGGNLVKLNQGIASGSLQFGHFSLSNDANYAVFIVEGELFGTSLDSGKTVSLNSDTGLARNFSISPDSNHVVFTAVDGQASALELFSVPIVGGSPIKINTTLVEGGSVRFNGYKITPDSTRVVYAAETSSIGTYELFSVAMAGGNSHRLSNDNLRGQGVDFFRFKISPDSSTVFYTADLSSGRQGLFSNAISGGLAKQLDPERVEGGFLEREFDLSFFGDRVVFEAAQDTARVYELYSVAVNSGAVRQLNSDLLENGTPIDSRFSPSWKIVPNDSEQLIYLAAQDRENERELYSVNLSEGPITKLTNHGHAGSGGVTSFQISPDGTSIVYFVGNPSQMYGRKLKSSIADDQLCFPISVGQDKQTTICL